jgi:hypothetical protein
VIYRKFLLFFFLLMTMVVAAEPPRNKIPDPELLLEADSYSIVVVQLKENREPVKALLEAALKSITSGETKLPASMAEVSNFLGRNNRTDLMFAALPFQAVRLDRMLNTKSTSPTYAATLAGWRGLQVNLYNSLCTAPDGKGYPSEQYRRTDLISREGANDPTSAGTLCRVDGTYLFSPTPAQAMATVDRLMPKDKPVPPVAGPLLNAYRAASHNADAYGITLNQKDAFSTLLKSMDNEYVKQVRDKVGSDRLERVVANTKSVVWQVDITSAERADFQATLTLEPKNVAEAASMFQDGRSGLDATKVTDIVITPAANTVTVKAAVVGLKKLMLDAMLKAGK